MTAVDYAAVASLYLILSPAIALLLGAATKAGRR